MRNEPGGRAAGRGAAGPHFTLCIPHLAFCVFLCVSVAAAAPATQGRDGDPRSRSRRAAAPLVIVTVAGLGMVAVALAAWTIHWGRRLRRRRIAGAHPRGAASGPDPWVAAGQRLQPPEEDDPERPR